MKVQKDIREMEIGDQIIGTLCQSNELHKKAEQLGIGDILKIEYNTFLIGVPGG